MTFRRSFQIAAKTIAMSFALAAVFVAASQAFGGPVSLVVVEGSSMQPGYHQGDLVLVRHSGSYASGDVVAYRSGRLGALVLHRIAAGGGDRFVLKGDNNSWTDPERPSGSDLLGRELVRVPAVGRLLLWVRTPAGAAAGVGLGLLAGAAAALRRRASRRGRNRSGAELGSSFPPVLRRAGGTRMVAGSVGTFAVLSIVLGLAGSIGSRDEGALAYEHAGSFSYSAKVSPGPVYQKELIETGDPVYLGVTRKVAVEFRYEFRSQSPHHLSGNGRLLGEIADDTGWKRVIELQPRQAFAADEATLQGELDLSAAQAAIARFQRATGVRGTSYALTLIPEIRVRGTLDGSEFEDAFDARLGFRLDSVLLRLGSSASDSDEDPLHPRSTGRLEGAGSDRDLASRAFLLPLSAVAARRMALAGSGLSVAGLLLLALFVAPRSKKKEDEAARILRHYRQWIVPIHAVAHRPAESVIDVTSMESLLRLADRYGRMVLHSSDGGYHTFLVDEERAVYRYRPRGPEVRSEAPGETPLEDPHAAAVKS